MDTIKTYKIYLTNIGKSFYTTKQYSLEAKQFEDFRKDFTKNNPSEHTHINDVIKAYLLELEQSNYALKTINKRKASLRSYLYYLYDRAYITAFNDELLLPFKIEKEPIETITEQDLSNILSFCHTCYELANSDENRWLAARNLLMVITVSYLGLKPSELIKMRWEHLDDDKMQLRIIGTRNIRYIDIDNFILDSFRYFKRDTANFMPEQADNPFIWLAVGNVIGEPITVKTVERFFSFLSEKMNMKITATTLRYYSFNVLTKDNPNVFLSLGYSRKDVLNERKKLLVPVKSKTKRLGT